MNIITYRNGNTVQINELRSDIEAARKNGLGGQYAFTPETVEACLDFIEELIEEGNRLADIAEGSMY